MKRRIFYLIGGFVLLMGACTPIEIRQDPEAALTSDQLKITITQNPAGSNTVVFTNETPAIMLWDWGTGTDHKAIDTIYLPFAGTYTLKYTAFFAGSTGSVTGTKTFSIAANDDAFFDKDPLWKQLTGGGTGQTWVFAMDHPCGNLAGNGPQECILPTWWTMTPAGYNQSTTTDEMTMDLNGAANFKRKYADGSTASGFFNIIAPFVNSAGTFHAFEVLGGLKFPWPGAGKYHVTNINANELSLHEYQQYNIALYKRKGYTY